MFGGKVKSGSRTLLVFLLLIFPDLMNSGLSGVEITSVVVSWVIPLILALLFYVLWVLQREPIRLISGLEMPAGTEIKEN